MYKLFTDNHPRPQTLALSFVAGGHQFCVDRFALRRFIALLSLAANLNFSLGRANSRFGIVIK